MSNKDFSAVEKLLDDDADVNDKDKEVGIASYNMIYTISQYEQTPLHIAAIMGYLGLIDLLKKHGANVDAADTVCYFYWKKYLPNSCKSMYFSCNTSVIYGMTMTVIYVYEHPCNVKP